MEDEKLNYEKFSEMDLVHRFCADPPDHDAFTAFWKRYEHTIRKYAKHFTIMCPHSYSPDIFAEDIFSKTQERVVLKIGGFRATARFSTWVYRIMEHLAIEERRRILGRSRKGPYVHVPITDAELSDDSAVFRDKVKHDPVHAAATRELKILVKGVLRDYVASEEGKESYEVIHLYVIDERPVSEIAAQRGTYDNEIYRMLEHDYEALKTSCTQVGLRGLLER